MSRISKSNRTIGEYLDPVAMDNGWSRRGWSNLSYEKDGYELYLYDNGFELVRIEPETHSEEVVVEHRDVSIRSPTAIATMQFILERAEIIVHEYDERL